MRFISVLLVVVACSGPTIGVSSGSTPSPIPTPTPTEGSIVPNVTGSTAPTTLVMTTTTTLLLDAYGRPVWLGTIKLPLQEGGFGEVQPTPSELIGRAFGTVDILAPPESATFASTVGSIPDDVLARSTWTAECPVAVDDLAYVTVSHRGFDGLAHTGELIVNRAVAEDIVSVFAALYEARYPIEEMRVVAAPELDLPPTGDGNNTTSFVCRATTGGTNWSQHAYGLAIDINPFQNPYVKGDLVLPELASYYTDRELAEPGIITGGGVVDTAFALIGWGWGGNWSSLKDWMHFSQNGS